MSAIRRCLLPSVWLLPCLLWASLLSAQAETSTAPTVPIFAGSELEKYLRVVQVAGQAPTGPYSLRPLTPALSASLAPSDSLHPWSGRLAVALRDEGGFGVLAPAASLFYNSGFPDGQNDGALWKGRGLTAAISGGVYASAGPVRLVLRPLAFLSQNASFDYPGGGSDPPRYAYPLLGGIDYPARFGDGPYGRVDWGQSALTLEFPQARLGIGTENSIWGPATDLPLILGNNAPGYSHFFVGTGAPLDIWIGAIHGRIDWGSLEQSDYSPAPAGERRLGSGVVAIFIPRGLPQLEIGGSRFYHQAWPEAGEWSSALIRPFESLFKEGTDERPADRDDNQLASVFARLLLQRNGVELYGEYAREDHNWHLRDFIAEPDHSRAFTLGFRKVWSGRRQEWWALQAELLNAQRSHLAIVRNQGPFYFHHAVVQGHTHRGQLLGSPAAVGGGGFRIRVDRYAADGRWAVAAWREIQADPQVDRWDGVEYPTPLDVRYGLALERLVFSGRVDTTARLSGDYNFNRYFGNDRMSFGVGVTLRYDPGIVDATP